MKTHTLPGMRMLVIAALALAAVCVPFFKTAHAQTVSATVTITAPVLVPGTPATISGSGFAPNETVHLTFGPHSIDINADGSGNVSTTLPIPSVPASLQVGSGFGDTSGRWALGYIWIPGFNPLVSPSAWYILPGQAITFSGTGFAPNESVVGSYNGTPIVTVTADQYGNFSTSSAVTLPITLHNTSATVTFAGATSKMTTSATLTIGQLFPTITPSAWYTGAGSTIQITGSGFAPSEQVVLTSGTSQATTSADSLGKLNPVSFTLPKGGLSATITAVGALSSAVTTATITMYSYTPWLTFSTYWAQGGSPLTISGAGFAPSESVGLFSGGTAIGTTTADATGSFSFIGNVPFAPAGTINIFGYGENSGSSGMGSITVAPVYTDLELASYAGAPGTAVTFIGHGYLPNEPISLTTDRTGSTTVATWTADATGSFNSSYVVPSTWTGGTLALTVTGQHSFDTKTIVYYVTGQ